MELRWGFPDWGFPYSKTGIYVFVCLTGEEITSTLLAVRVTLGNIDSHLLFVTQQCDREAFTSFISEYVTYVTTTYPSCAPVEVDLVNKYKAPALYHSKILS